MTISFTFVILQFQFCNFMLVLNNFQTLSELRNFRLLIQKQNWQVNSLYHSHSMSGILVPMLLNFFVRDVQIFALS
jgi:hypothetical protein